MLRLFKEPLLIPPSSYPLRLPLVLGGDTENPGFCRRRAELRGCAYPEEPA